jgi:C4-dicarboxylate transporter
MIGFGILIGLVVLVGGLLFAFGLMGDQKILIAAGLLLLALCAIFGVQPDWPVKRRPE